MTTWYLASHGEVTGPFELEEARKSIQSNKTQDPQFFVWQSNFVYWQAAYAVGEFSDLVQEVEHSSPVFDDLKERFKEREEILSNRVSHVDGRLKQACDNLMTFEDDIIAYKKLTANFGPEVQGAIAAIEKKYKSLSKKIDGIVSATEIAETEVANASKAFAAIESDEAEEELIEEEVAVEEPVTQKQEAVEQPKIQKQAVEQKQPEAKPEAKPVAKKEPAPKPVAKPLIQKAAEAAPQASSQQDRAQEKQEQEVMGKGILGMKKMLKSVFKEPEPAPKLSEMLNRTESAPAKAEEPAEEDVELVVVDVDEEEATAKKRRRRRRR